MENFLQVLVILSLLVLMAVGIRLIAIWTSAWAGAGEPGEWAVSLLLLTATIATIATLEEHG
jgi:hypothetical protein